MFPSMRKKSSWTSFGVYKLKYVKKYIEDVLIFTGLVFVNVATYRISSTAGLYATGITLLALGVYFALNPVDGG